MTMNASMTMTVAGTSSATSSCAPVRLPATVPAGSSGLALLQRRGVVAWTRAWPQQPAPVRACPPAPVPAAGDELVGALATMALARLAA